MGFGGNLMLWKHFGAGAEVSFQPGKQNYLSLPTAGTGLTSDVIQSRMTFFDVNGIFGTGTDEEGVAATSPAASAGESPVL